MDRVKVALVGCGTIARAMHLPGIKAIEGMGKAELVAACDAIPQSLEAAREQFGIRKGYTDLGVMLADEPFDLLVNTTPIPQHYAVTLAALRAGKHVYTQKPMTTTVAEATELIEEAKRRGVLLASAPEHPTRPTIQAMGRMVEGGEIGTVAFAIVRSSHDGPEKHDVPRDSTWYYKPGSTPLLDLGVHGLSQITAILGPVRKLSCVSGRSQQTRITTAGPYKGKPIDVEIDDNSHLLLDFGGATFAHMDATYCVEATLGPRLEIYGSDGVLAIAGQGATSALQRYSPASKAWATVDVPETPPVRDLGVLHMVDCLLTGQPLILTGERGRHLVEVLTKAPIAAQEGRTLTMETVF